MHNPPLILTVDDEKDFLDIVSDKLKISGFSVESVNNGKEAITMAKNTMPDLILMDVQMPGKDGIETTIDLQHDEATKDIKIMFLTNLGDSWPSVGDINRRFAQQIGAVDYFKKGGDLDLLVGKIKKIIAS